MKQISNKEYERYHQYQEDRLHGRILTPVGHLVICVGFDNHPEIVSYALSFALLITMYKNGYSKRVLRKKRSS